MPSTAVKTITFLSPSRNLRLRRLAATEMLNRQGDPVVTHQGLYYTFEEGRLEVEPGQDVLDDGPAGAEQDAVAWLRGHHAFNSSSNPRFHEDGAEPGRPFPPDNAVIEEITAAIGALDGDALRDIWQRETDTFGREVLLHAAQSGLNTVDEVLAGQADPKAKKT